MHHRRNSKGGSYSPDLTGQRVLVTGGLGFIGSNVAHECLRLGAHVSIYDCLDPRSGGNIYNVHEIKDSVRMVPEDILNFEGMCGAVMHQDIIFACAAHTSHPASMRDPLLDIEVNCKGTINVLEAARRFNRDVKIVHVGTSTQIGRMRRSPVDELHPEFPVDIYSANKSASEKYTLIYGNAYGLRTTVVRLANVFGPRSNIKSRDFGFVNYFIGLGLQGKDLPVFGKGGQRRNISYVEDCVCALILASQCEEAKGEVFFAGSDEQLEVVEIAEQIAHYIGGTVRSVEWPKEREVIEVGDAIISNKKIKRVLKWAPVYDLGQGLAKTKEFYGSCLEKYLG